MDNLKVYHALQDALSVLQAVAPTDDTEVALRYAAVATKLQDTITYFNDYVLVPGQAQPAVEHTEG